MAELSVKVNGSTDGVSFLNNSNIAAIGSTSFNTIALSSGGGTAQMNIFIEPRVYNYGTVKSVVISYKAYGSRTGVLGARAVVRTGADGVDVNSHGDVGRGSNNPTNYPEDILKPISYQSGISMHFKCINNIAAQTNTVYVFDISITINYTPLTHTITAKASPENGGTVTGTGDYEDGKTATLTATPKNGYKFVKWSDGVTTASRTVTVTGNATYTAVFELDTINNILVNKVKPKEIYFDEHNIVFVVDGDIPTLEASLYDTVDGHHFKVQNTAPSGMTKCKKVYRDLVKVYG